MSQHNNVLWCHNTTNLKCCVADWIGERLTTVCYRTDGAAGTTSRGAASRAWESRAQEARDTRHVRTVDWARETEARSAAPRGDGLWYEDDRAEPQRSRRWGARHSTAQGTAFPLHQVSRIKLAGRPQMATTDMGRKCGEGELGPHLTQYGRGLSPCQVSSWNGRPKISLVIRSRYMMVLFFTHNVRTWRRCLRWYFVSSAWEKTIENVLFVVIKYLLERCNPSPHVANRHISGQLLSLWRHSHHDVIRDTAAGRPVPTSHYDVILIMTSLATRSAGTGFSRPVPLIMTSFWLWRHLRHAHRYVRTNERTYRV